jgi:hypothetical protein
MWLGDALTLDAGAPTAASGEPFDAAAGCLFVLFVAANTTAATHSPETSRSASRTYPPLTHLIVNRLLGDFQRKFFGSRRAD